MARVEAFVGESIGARHDDELASVRASTAALMRSTISPVGTNSLSGTVSAALGAYLVFDMNGGGAGLDHRADGARDVEGAAPAGVDIDEQRQSTSSVMRRTSVSTSSMVLMPRSGMPSELAATPPPDK